VRYEHGIDKDNTVCVRNRLLSHKSADNFSNKSELMGTDLKISLKCLSDNAQRHECCVGWNCHDWMTNYTKKHE